MGIAMAPATFKQELDPSQDNANGRILASRLSRAESIRANRRPICGVWPPAPRKECADDIDQDHVPREAQQAEKDYSSAMQAQDGN